MNCTLRTFAPELWGEVDRFSNFFVASFPKASALDRRAVAGVSNHFRKSLILRHLAEQLKRNVEIDRQELHEKGYTPASNSAECAAIIENVFTELYSAIDCTRKIIVATHKLRGVPDSTRRLFRRIQNHELDAVLPPELVDAFARATWYDRLLTLRDELTHSDIGSCHLNDATGKVSYMHTGLGQDNRALVIDDVYARLDEDIDNVNRFLGEVFRYMNRLLADRSVVVLCGMAQGRALIRELKPAEIITFDSGVCRSLAWIEVDGVPTCPFLCGAYRSAKRRPQPDPIVLSRRIGTGGPVYGTSVMSADLFTWTR